MVQGTGAESGLLIVLGGLLSGLQAAILFILSQIHGRMKEYIANNKSEHAELWDRIHHHKHDKENGNVVITN